MRTYSTYDVNETKALIAEAKARGLSVSGFQKHCVLKVLGLKQTVNIPNLITMMENNIKTLTSGNTFVISALLPEDYYNCNKPEQTQLAKTLKKYAEDHPDIIKPHGKVKSTTQYIKI